MRSVHFSLQLRGLNHGFQVPEARCNLCSTLHFLDLSESSRQDMALRFQSNTYVTIKSP